MGVGDGREKDVGDGFGSEKDVGVGREGASGRAVGVGEKPI